MQTQPITVLVIEDSSVVQMLLVQILSADPHIQVIGTAKNGEGALQFLAGRSPDVIVMDIDRPHVDGFETTRRIMETRPLPIVICGGSTNTRDKSATFRLMAAGALACVEKPLCKDHKDFESLAAVLRQTVKSMAEVKVVRRWPRRETSNGKTLPTFPPKQERAKVEFVGIGASTGGPPVLQTILSGLPKDFPASLLVVQHISPGFLPGMVDWLNQTTGFDVQIASHDARALPGRAYLAPDGLQMAIRPGGQIVLSRSEPENGLRPSIAHLFRSLADVFGPSAAGVLLTGMGTDGAQELKHMKDRGASTIVQDEETSVVHGMPGQAISLGAATYVLPADKIAPVLIAEVTQESFR